MSRASPRFKRISPPLPLVGVNNGVVLYKMIGTLEGQMTICDFMYSGPVNNPTQAQLIALLTSISAALFAAFKAAVSADWSVVNEQLVVAHRNDIAGVNSILNFGAVGGRAAGHEPTEIAIVILRNSSVKGQHGRGRVSLPAVSTADVTASKVSAAAEITALTQLSTQMLVNASDGVNTWNPCIGQRSVTPPRLVIGFSPLVRVAASLLLGTVRRRKLGRGK